MSRQRKKPTISALEPRILFDGAAVATTVEVLDNSSFDSSNETQAEDTPPASQTPTTIKDRVEIAFVDKNLSDYQTLVDGISSDIEVYLVDSSVNGLDFMADILSTMQDVDALHILGHGSDGNITLGTTTLNKDNLSQYDDVLLSIGNSISDSGDILLYGCSVSSSENGISFIQSLSELTQADIAASNDATGLGGDWELESTTGSIETQELSFPTYIGDMGTPSISGLQEVTFTENGSAVTPGSGISITNGTSYDGKYIEYSLSNGSSSDQLTLTSASNVNASGAISVDGSNVYLGNGSSRDVIGSIDSTYNGQNGQKLRINFVSSFSNASFETGTITGWTAMNQMIDLGSTVIAGWTSQDTSDYSNNPNSGGNDNDVPSGSYSTSVVSETGNHTDGSYALKLTSTMTTANGYDVVHGPAVYSSEFQASAGDVIYFDWRAYAGGDDFDAFGYIVNVNTGAQIEVLDATGSSNTAWTTKATTISTSGTYRFVFVNGTYDASGGRAAGGQLYIDNVRVYGSKVNDAVVTSISKLVTFSNTSESPTTTARTFTVTAVDSNGNSGSASSTINVTSVNDLPYITGRETVTVNEDTSITISGISVSDVDATSLTVTIDASHGTLSLGNSTGVTTSWDSVNKTFTITGSSANLNTALATLRYQGDSNWFGSDPLTITVNDGQGSGEQPYRINQTGKFFNTENGHYYEFVSASGITWDDAKTDAEARTLYGLNGYLVTITSAEENALMMSMAGGNGWIGASDANSEGIWQWVTGPEAGTRFWTGDTNAGTNSTSNYGSSYNGQYANWASGEPNNSDGSRGGEDVAHFYYSGTNAGKWNDFAATNTSSIAGYIVEYGGAGGTLTAANLTVTVVPVNDLPVNSVPTARTTNEDTNIVFSSGNSNAITVGDNDSLNDPSIILTTTVSIGSGKGTLSATTGGGATINGNGTTTVQIIGTVTQINAALEGLTYAPTADANGSAYTTLTVATNDGTTTDTDTVTINITAVDDKPVANAMAATVGPNSKQSFDQFMPNFSDVDNNIMTEAYQLEILSLPTVGKFQVYDGSGDKADDGNWVDITDISALTQASGYTIQNGRLVISMANLNNYRFDAGDNSGSNTNVNWRVMTAGDTSDTTGWSNSATGVVTILNTASNTAPTVNIYSGSIDSANLLNNGTITINEDSSQANIILLFEDDYTPEEYIQGIISSTNTDLIDMSCISYTRSTTTNTGDTVTFTFTPKANKYGTTTITLGANDGDKSATQSFTLNVTSVNEQAIVDNFTKVIDEDDSFSFATINPADIYHDSNDVNANTDVSAVDYNAQMAIIQDAMMNPSDTDKQTAKAAAITALVDANYFPQSFIIDTLPTNGDLYLGSTKITTSNYTVAIADLETLSYQPDADYYGTDSFTWHALDKEGLATDVKTATFTINAVNDAPVATTPNTIEITDTSGASITGTISSTLSATDVDNPTLTYTIIDNASDVTTITGTYGTLTIDSSTGDYTYVPNLTAITALNANTTETFTLKVSDGSLNDTVTLTINITATAETSSIYNEQDSATLIMTDTSIDTDESYGGGYVEFEIGSATATEILSLHKVGTADITDGVVSIVGNAVYLGNGTSASAIGQIDGIYNGQNGQKLRINFAVDFTNGNFNSSNSSVGLLSSTTNAMINIDGWTIVNGRVNLGVDTIAGLATPEDTTNPAKTISATDKDGNSLVRGTFYTYINDDDGNSGNDNSIKMNSSLTSANGYAIVRGPYIYSDSAVSLKVGDSVQFDWKAQGGSDAYDVFGYIIDVNNPSNYQIILNRTGANASAMTNWATESITVATDGDYKFVFVSGSWDATGGKALGAQLYIDDVKVTQANPTSNLTSDVLEKIAQKVTYQNTSDLTANNGTINRTVTVTASSGDATPVVHTSTKSITINESNDPVALTTPQTIYYTDTDGTDVFSAKSGQLSATDADSNTTYTYGIDGGTISGSTVTKAGAYGTLTINRTTGAYTYTPDSNAMNALSSNVTEQFTFNVSDGSGSTDSQVLTISIDSVNDAPLLGGTAATQTYVENGSAVQVDPNITITDLEGTSYNGGYISFSITANKESLDNLSVLNLGGITLSGSNVNYNGQTIGTIDSVYNGQNGNDLRINLNANAYSLDVQALARAVGFSNPSDNFNTQSRAIEIKVNDGGDGGNTTARYSTKTVAVNLQAINDLPTSNLGTSSFIVEKAISTNPNGTLALGSIISFADLDDTQLTVKLETTNYGSLYLRDDVTNGVNSSQIIGNNSRTVTITGTIEEINATLAASDGITYTAGYGNDFVTPGADYLKVTAIDSSLQEAISKKMVLVLPAVPNAYSDNVVGNEDGNIAIDIDTLIADINENTGTYTFGTGTPDITNSSGVITTAGSMTTFDNSKVIYADYDIDGDGDIDNDDTSKPIGFQLTHGKLILNNDKNLADDRNFAQFTFIPDENWYGVESFLYQYNSGDGEISNIAQISIFVTPINDAPVISVNPTVSMNEDGSFTFENTNLISLSDVDFTGNEDFSATLNVESGILQLSSLNNLTVLEGTDNSSYIKIRGNLTDIQNAINALKYLPNENYNGNDSLSITLSDLGNIGEGDILESTSSITISISAINDAPYFVDQTDYVAENTVKTGVLPISDIDSPSYTVRIADGSVAPTGFTIDSDGHYRFDASSYNSIGAGETQRVSVDITVDDGNSINSTTTKTLEFIIEGENDAPFVKDGVNLNQRIAFGETYDKDLSVIFDDLDVTDTHTYEIVGLPKGLKYDPNTGKITGKAEGIGKFTITVKSTDSSGETVEYTYQLEVTAPPQTPTVQQPTKEPVNDFKPQDYNAPMGGYNVNNGDTNNTGDVLDSLGGNENQSPLAQSANPLAETVKTVNINVGNDGQVVFDDNKNGMNNDDFGIESVNIENKFIAITISGDQDQTYNATLADGSPLPSGFVIDSKTGTITGILPEGVEELDIIIQASGKDGVKTINVKINIKDMKGNQQLVPLQKQVSAEIEKQESYGTSLLFNLSKLTA